MLGSMHTYRLQCGCTTLPKIRSPLVPSYIRRQHGFRKIAVCARKSGHAAQETVNEPAQTPEVTYQQDQQQQGYGAPQGYAGYQGQPYQQGPYMGPSGPYAPPPQPYQQYGQGYVGVPEFPAAALPPVQATKPAGFPWMILGIGVAVGLGASKLLQLVTGGPAMLQQKAQEAMLKQMMGSMKGPGGAGSPFGAGAGGPSPFGGGVGGPSPFGGFPPPPPGGFQMPPKPPQPAATPSASKTIDVEAEAPAAGTSSRDSSAASKGSKYQELKAREAELAAREAALEEKVRRGGASARREKRKASFTDVEEEDKDGPSTSGSNGASTADSPSFNGGGAMPPPFSAPFKEAEVMDGGAGGGQKAKSPVDLLERLMGDPKMQQLLYPYLPEPMRNAETFEWMMKNPEYRAQLEQMVEQQGASFSPEMLNMMENFDYNNPEIQKQFDSMGVSPSDVIQKIMAEPDLAAAFAKPSVQAAIMDITQNPMNIIKYQSDAEVMKVLEKMQSMFPAMPNQ